MISAVATGISIAGITGITVLDSTISALMRMCMLTANTTTFLICGTQDDTSNAVSKLDVTERIAIIEAFINEESAALDAHRSTQLARDNLKHIIRHIQCAKAQIDQHAGAIVTYIGFKSGAHIRTSLHNG